MTTSKDVSIYLFIYLSIYLSIFKVLEAMTGSLDVPEELVVDFVDYITDVEKHDIS